jgi:DNA adenine methylase
MSEMAVRALPPVIKWPGSKRRIARVLGRLFPRDAGRYIEPFVGGGALLPFRPGHEALAGDRVKELVDLWLEIRERPRRVASEYEERWNQLQEDGHSFFYIVRERFNAERDPHDLLFLSRTCVNGLVRFNATGEFNNSFHHARPGIAPRRLEAIVQSWHGIVQGVKFVAADYRANLADAGSGDVVFLDPPYAFSRGRYHPGRLDLNLLWAELERLNCVGARWVLTLDGRAGERTYDLAVPQRLWHSRLSLPTGQSPFTRLMRRGLDDVYETVYLNFRPPAGPDPVVSVRGRVDGLRRPTLR